MHAAIETFLKATSTERKATADVLRSLIPIMDDKLYLHEGYTSLFAFLTERCRYSEASAYRRIAAARVVKLKPESLGMVEAGTLTLCSMAELSKVLNSENAANLLDQTQGLSKRRTEALVAQQLPPAKVARESIRKVAVTKPLPPVKAPCTGSPLFEQAQQGRAPEPQEATDLQLPPVVVTSYAFLGDKEFDQLLKQVMVHTGRKPLTDILKTAMRSYLKEKEPKTKQMRPFNATGRYIPKHVRQTVIERDHRQCCFVSEAGVRCSSTVGLQIDHTVPFAKGGLTELRNLRTLCAAHNLHEAENVFGREKVNFHQRSR
jgi:hypothetical protein